MSELVISCILLGGAYILSNKKNKYIINWEKIIKKNEENYGITYKPYEKNIENIHNLEKTFAARGITMKKLNSIQIGVKIFLRWHKNIQSLNSLKDLE